MVSPSRQSRFAARKVNGRHLKEVIHGPVASRALTCYQEGCVADCRASGAGTGGRIQPWHGLRAPGLPRSHRLIALHGAFAE